MSTARFTICFALGGRPRVCTGRCAFQLLLDFCRGGPSGYGGRAHGSYRRRKGRRIEAVVAAMSAIPLVAMIERRYSCLVKGLRLTRRPPGYCLDVMADLRRGYHVRFGWIGIRRRDGRRLVCGK